jgi:hypothetical protein
MQGTRTIYLIKTEYWFALRRAVNDELAVDEEVNCTQKKCRRSMLKGLTSAPKLRDLLPISILHVGI